MSIILNRKGNKLELSYNPKTTLIIGVILFFVWISFATFLYIMVGKEEDSLKDIFWTSLIMGLAFSIFVFLLSQFKLKKSIILQGDKIIIRSHQLNSKKDESGELNKKNTRLIGLKKKKRIILYLFNRDNFIVLNPFSERQGQGIGVGYASIISRGIKGDGFFGFNKDQAEQISNFLGIPIEYRD